jgi:hypothetical protein
MKKVDRDEQARDILRCLEHVLLLGWNAERIIMYISEASVGRNKTADRNTMSSPRMTCLLIRCVCSL